MEAEGLIDTRPDPADGRRRVLLLSEEGSRRLPGLKALWAIFAEELDSIIEATAGRRRARRPGTPSKRSSTAPSSTCASCGACRSQAGRPSTRPGSRRPSGIRGAESRDREPVLHIARELVRTADTYAYEPDIGDEELWRVLVPARSGQRLRGRARREGRGHVRHPPQPAWSRHRTWPTPASRCGRRPRHRPGATDGRGLAEARRRAGLQRPCSSTPWSAPTSTPHTSGARWASAS